MGYQWQSPFLKLKISSTCRTLLCSYSQVTKVNLSLTLYHLLEFIKLQIHLISIWGGDWAYLKQWVGTRVMLSSKLFFFFDQSFRSPTENRITLSKTVLIDWWVSHIFHLWCIMVVSLMLSILASLLGSSALMMPPQSRCRSNHLIGRFNYSSFICSHLTFFSLLQLENAFCMPTRRCKVKYVLYAHQWYLIFQLKN